MTFQLTTPCHSPDLHAEASGEALARRFSKCESVEIALKVLRVSLPSRRSVLTARPVAATWVPTEPQNLTNQCITISFNISNFAGTVTKISIDFDVTTTAKLIKDIGQTYLPYYDLSLTLQKLLGLA